MRAVRGQLDRTTDWYDRACQQLDVLRHNAHNYADNDEVIPPDSFFESVKIEIQNIRQLADFPNLPEADVWLGPNGEIGLTWDKDEQSFDLVFTSQNIIARLTNDLEQRLIEKKNIPTELASFAN